MEYFSLLKRNKTVRILSSIQTISYFGSWFTQVAILTLLTKLGASAFVISAAVAVSFLPALIQGPFAGVLVDRVDIKRLMSTLLLTEAVSTTFFIFIDSGELLWLLFLLLYIKMSAASLYFVSEMSLLPKLLSEEELKSANEIHSIVWSASFTAGMALGGISVAYLGTTVSFLIDASLFIVAIFIFFNLPIPPNKDSADDGYLSAFLGGLRYVFKTKPKLLAFIALHATVGLTVFDGIITVLADSVYKNTLAVSLAIGFLGAIRSVALIIGPFLFSKFINRERLFWLLLAQGCALMIWGALSGDFWLSMVGSFLCGLFTTTIWSYTMTMLQNETDKEYYGRVVSINDMFFTLTSTLTSFGVGALMELGVTPGETLFLLGVLFLLSALLYRRGFSVFAKEAQK